MTLAGSQVRSVLTRTAALLLAGCATSVEHVPLADPVFAPGDTPHYPHRDDVRVSRDGRVLAVRSVGLVVGLPGDEPEYFRVDRVDGVASPLRSACGIPATGGAADWDLSEDGRYLMEQHRRVDLETCEVTEIAGYDSIWNTSVYFADGSGLARRDDSIPGIRVSYYDGRPDVSVELPPMRLSTWVSDRSGHRLFVSSFERAGPTGYDDVAHWMVTLPEGVVTPVALDGVVGTSREVPPPGFFSDDGSAFYALATSRLRRIDVATLEVTELPGAVHSLLSAPLDDGRLVTATNGAAEIADRVVYLGPEASEWMLSVAPAGELQPLVINPSRVLRDYDHFPLPYAEYVISAPASRELFVSLHWPNELAVVQVPPLRAP